MSIPPELEKYHLMGLPLIPITAKDGKKQPLIEYKGYREKPQDLATLQGLYETYKDIKPLQWAVYCVNGIVGLDFDTAADYDAFFSDIDTLTTRSPRGGYHAFIRSLTLCKAFDVLGIEVKVNVLCTISGAGYEIFKDKPIKEFDDVETFLVKKFPKIKVDKKVKDVSIIEVIGKYAEPHPIKKDHIFTARCPIHSDNENEHLYIYENTNSWYCFKCKKGGDSIAFIKTKEGITKKEDALKFLENLLGMELTNDDGEKALPKSTILINNVLYEEVKTKEGYRFVNFNGNGFEYHKELIALNDVGEEITCVPCTDEEILKGAVVIGKEPTDYVSKKQLIDTIDAFVYKWMDIPEQDRKFYTYYIMQSWVFEKFHTIGYARAIGDTGVGKTRFLDVVGGLCYKPMFTVGAIGAAPIFRILDKHRGTLIIDEANFGKTDETEAIITILNAGWEKGKPILRCNKDQNMALNTFDAFSPKVLATRKKFSDTALEARCYTVSITQTDRDDIPANLDDSFFMEREEIASRLMAFRLKNINTVEPKPELQEKFKDIEPRLIQKALPLAAIVESEPEALKEFIKYVQDSQEDLVDERQGSQEGKTALAVLDLYEGGLKADNSLENIIISGEDIATKLNEDLPEKRKTNSQKVGKMLKTLGFSRTQKQVKDSLDTTGKKRILKRALDTNLKLLSKMLRRYTFLNDGTYPNLRGVVSSVSSHNGMSLKTNFIKDAVTGIGETESKNTPSVCPIVIDTLDTLDTKIRESGKKWQELYGQINSINKVKFCMWFCEQAGNGNMPSEIEKRIEKIFKITPSKNTINICGDECSISEGI